MNGGALCAIDDSALALDVGNSVEGPSLNEVSFGFGERALEGVETAGMRCGESDGRTQGGGSGESIQAGCSGSGRHAHVLSSVGEPKAPKARVGEELRTALDRHDYFGAAARSAGVQLVVLQREGFQPMM